MFIDESKCSKGIKSLKNFKRDWDEKMGSWKSRPRHDWAMHGYDALETLIRGLTMFDGQSSNHHYKPAPAASWRVL